MTLASKIGALLVTIVGSALIVIVILSFARPLATIVWLRRSALRRAGFRKTKVATPAGVQTVWHGGAGPLLVLLHGAGDQAGTWSKVAPELKRHFRLVIPDLAGHGESEPRTGALSLGTLLTALEKVLETIPGPAQTIAIAGNSMGAWMAMLYQQRHPHRVARLILIDGGPIKGATDIGIMPKDREEARRTMDAVLDSSTPRPPNFVLDDLICVSNSGPISRLMAAGVDDMGKYLLDDQLANVRIPVALLWGGSDRLVPLEYAKKLQAQLPQCTLTVIERCGHAPQLERPREFTEALLQVLGLPSARELAPAPSVSGQPRVNS